MATEPKNSITFNKSNLDKLPFAAEGKQVTYYDANPTNLCLRVGAKSKTFSLRKRVNGLGIVRLALGKYGQISIAKAATLAAKHLAKLSEGVNPAHERQKASEALEQKKSNNIETLQWLLNKYKEDHLIGKKGGAKTTLHDMETTESYFNEREVMTLKMNDKGEWVDDMKVHLSNWLDRPFRSVTRQEVLDRFEVFAKAKPSRKPKVMHPITRSHQKCFKMVAAAYQFAIKRLELDINENFISPFDILTRQDKWEKTNIRTNFLDFRKREFRDWFLATQEYDKKDKGVVSDYLIVSLLQVARSFEAAPLLWKNVDLKLKNIRYVNTKNGNDYDMPMTKLVYEILKRREKKSFGGVFVFENQGSKKYGYIDKSCQHHLENIAEMSGKLITHHDLRRTWATAAQSLKQDKMVIDYCLRHKTNGVDAHYFMRNRELILECLQDLEDFFIKVTKKTKFEQ